MSDFADALSDKVAERAPSWLKGEPGDPPSFPLPVDLEQLNAQAHELEGRGITSGPAMAYLRAHAPRVILDRWGEPLPLSLPDQARLDRLMAVLSSPLDRGRALILSGTLDSGECAAIREVYPSVYGQLCQQARMDMAMTPLPYQAWAESTLNVLFGQPTAKVYGDAHPSPAANGKTRAEPDANIPVDPTQADRREVSVRQNRGDHA